MSSLSRAAVLLSFLLAVPAARADVPPPPPPHEWGLGALEFLGGSAAAVATLAGAIQLSDMLDLTPTGRDGMVVGALVVLPLVQGLIACAIGGVSKHYRGGCLWPILGAYLGALPFVPISYLASNAQPDALGQGIVGAFFLGVGVVIAAPAGATIAWNATKTPREPLSTLLPPRPTGLPPVVAIPILTARF